MEERQLELVLVLFSYPELKYMQASFHLPMQRERNCCVGFKGEDEIVMIAALVEEWRVTSNSLESN